MILDAIEKRRPQVVKLLIAHGVSPNLKTHDTRSPLPLLHDAIEKEDVEIVKVLVKAGADINAKVDDETPLLRARRKGLVAIEKVLLDAGAKFLP